MIGKPESKICPVCGGPLDAGMATIPYILDKEIVIVIRSVPAEICGNCHEPFTNSNITDQVLLLLNELKALRSEVSVVSYPEYALA